MQIKHYVPTDHKVKALVYGASGSGKTVFASTAKKPIFASAEAGLLSVRDSNIPYVEIKTLDDLKELFEYLKTEKHDYETVIIDSITEVNEIIKSGIEKKTGRDIQKNDWTTVSKRIKDILRDFRNLPMDVLFIAQEIIEKDGDEISRIVPGLNGKMATDIPYYMDIVGYMGVDKVTGEHKIVTKPHQRLVTKDRSDMIGNDTEPNFSVWVSKVQSIKTGTQDIIVDKKMDIPPEEEAPAEPPKDQKEPPKSTRLGELSQKREGKMGKDKFPLLTTRYQKQYDVPMAPLLSDDQVGELIFTIQEYDSQHLEEFINNLINNVK